MATLCPNADGSSDGDGCSLISHAGEKTGRWSTGRPKGAKH